MKNVFEYTSYRTFLKEYYEARKAVEGYTYRDFSKETGMNSSSWLLHLVKGVKNLSNDTTLRIAKALHFSKNETEYFKMLVHFTQAKKSEAKNLFFNQMMDLKKKLKIIRINEQQYEYYTKWYYPVVRSLVSKFDWDGNYALLAKKLLPPITPREAKKSVTLLESLGFIEKNIYGKWIQKDDVISTGDEVMSLNIVNYHKQVTKLAENAFDRSQKEWRDISSLTIGINGNDVKAIKARIQQFRREIIDIARASENADRVYQLNFHFFPVSKPEGRGNGFR
jgi:uncharacterized protein (TIGR02147 family)